MYRTLNKTGNTKSDNIYLFSLSWFIYRCLEVGQNIRKYGLELLMNKLEGVSQSTVAKTSTPKFPYNTKQQNYSFDHNRHHALTLLSRAIY